MPWLFSRPKRTTPHNSPRSQITWASGRRHLNDTPYVLPNDLEDANRLDFQHFMLRFILQGNFGAPIKNPLAILDVAGGTGRWGMEMAQMFPNANVYSLDVAAPSTDIGSYHLDRVPPNYVFIQKDMFKGLPFEANTFDFVHMRMVFGAVPVSQWPVLVSELVRVTKPGGWVESVEGTIFEFSKRIPAPATQSLMNQVVELCNVRGIDSRYGERMPAMFGVAGLGNILSRTFSCSTGYKAGGRLGVMIAADSVSAFKGMGTLFVKNGNMTADELDSAIHQMERECEAGAIKWPIRQTIGQKPFLRV